MKTLSVALMTSAAMPVAFANDGSKPRVEPLFTGTTDAIEMPVRTNNRGSKSIYPFDTLTKIGMAFGVKNKTAASLSSVISNANKKAVKDRVDANGQPVFKTIEIKDAAGTVIGTQPSTSEREKDVTAKYFAVDVDAAMTKKIKGTPLEGSTALVFREA